jgi:RNA polymerase sigma factor (sigma-70 family)
MLEFTSFYQEYAPDVYRFAYWLSGSGTDADDITAETFLRAWINFNTVRTETVKAFLMTIARNIYLGQLRKGSKQIILKEDLADPLPGLEQDQDIQGELEMARRVLQNLPESERAAFVLRVQHDMPYAEIARVLQVSETAVKVKVHRTRQKMLAARLRVKMAESSKH